MVYAIQLYLGFRSTARRDTTAGNIATKFGASALYEQPQVDSVDHLWHATDPALIVTARFLTAADRDDMWTQIDTYLGTGTNGPVTGSRGWIHDCTADELGGGSCAINSERVW
jgi:hypothetical protein